MKKRTFRILLGGYFVFAAALYFVFIHGNYSDISQLREKQTKISDAQRLREKRERIVRKKSSQLQKIETVAERFTQKVGEYTQEELIQLVGDMARRNGLRIKTFDKFQRREIRPCRFYQAHLVLSGRKYTDLLAFVTAFEQEKNHLFWIEQMKLNPDGGEAEQFRMELRVMLATGTTMKL